MIKINTRKIVLLAADLILVLVLILQGVSKAKDNVNVFEYKDTPDTLTITSAAGTLNIVNENDKWFVGDKKYPANESSVTSLLDAIAEVKTLDKMGKASNESVLSRYDLQDASAITVTAIKEGKVLRTLKLGKDSSTGVQCYGTVDNGHDVYLISGNLRNTFEKTAEDLRSRIVIDLEKNNITSATVKNSEGAVWTLSRSGEGENLSWNISGADVEIDSSKATEWFNSLASLATSKWHEAGQNLGGTLVSETSITCGGKTEKLEIFIIPADPAVEDAKDTYWGRCTTTPYTFEVANYSVSKFNKNVSELAK